MRIEDKLKELQREKPHYSCARLAEELGIKVNVARAVAGRAKMRFLNRRDLEDMIDGKA